MLIQPKQVISAHGFLLAMSLIIFSSSLSAFGPEWNEYVKPFEKVDIAVGKTALEPSMPIKGELTHITTTVTNNSKPDTSVDISIFVGGKVLNTQNVYLPGYSTRTLTIEWHPIAEGLQDIIVRAEVPNEVVEVSTVNNVNSISVTVAKTHREGADLRIIDIEQNPIARGRSQARIKIRNQGGVSSTAPLEVYLGETLLETRIVGPVAPGEEKLIKFSIPEQISTGNELRVLINTRFRNAEFVHSDYERIVNMGPLHDIAVRNLSIEAINPDENGTEAIVVNFDIINLGTIPLNGNVEATLELFKPGEGKEGKPSYRNDWTLSDLKSAEVVHITEIIEQSPGRFDIVITATPNESFKDESPENNHASWQYRNPSPEIDRWVSIGPATIDLGLGSTGRLHQIVIDPINPDRIYVGAPSPSKGKPGGMGVWRSSDAGETWRPLTDNLPSLAIAGLALDPTDHSVLFVVTMGKGIYRCTQFGTICRQHTVANLNPHGESQLIIHPENPQVMYLTSTDGVYRGFQKQRIAETSHGVINIKSYEWDLWGVSDSASTSASPTVVQSLVMNSKNHDELFSAVYQKATFNKVGVWKTSDGGEIWERATGCELKGDSRRLPTFNKKAVVMLGQSSGTIYASVKFDDSKVEIYRSMDTNCSDGQPAWEKRGEFTEGRLRGAPEIAVDPNNVDRVYVSFTGGNLWVSENGGKKFTPSSGPHMDHHDFAFNPSQIGGSTDVKIVYAATDGGLYRSENYGDAGTWKLISGGITNAEIYDIAFNPDYQGYGIAGTQDNGNIRYQGSNNWLFIGDGDGYTVAIDRSDTNTVYGLSQYIGSLKRYNLKSGSGGKQIACGINGRACYQPHYILHPRNQKVVLLACGDKLFHAEWPECTEGPSVKDNTPGKGRKVVNKDGSISYINPWTSLLSTGGRTIARAGVNPEGGITVIGTDRGEVYATADATDLIMSHSWKHLFNQASMASVTDIEFDPWDKDAVYVSFASSGSRSDKIIRFELDIVPSTTDPAKSEVKLRNSAELTKVASGFPIDAVVFTIATHVFDEDVLFAGTNRGVYRGRKANAGADLDWSEYNNGLPEAAHVTDLEVHLVSGSLRASTLGRGAYLARLTFSPEGEVEDIIGHVLDLVIDPPPFPPPPVGKTLTINLVLVGDGDKERRLHLKINGNEDKEYAIWMRKVLQSAYKNRDKVRIVIDRNQEKIPYLRKIKILQ